MVVYPAVLKTLPDLIHTEISVLLTNRFGGEYLLNVAPWGRAPWGRFLTEVLVLGRLARVCLLDCFVVGAGGCCFVAQNGFS